MAEGQNRPTDSMVAAARRALAWKKEGRAGGTSIGLARANQIVNRENLSDDTVKRMYSFFSRHEVDKKATGFNSGEEGFPSAGRVAWDLWGGDSGYSWSRQKVNQMKRESVKRMDPFELEKKDYNSKQRQQMAGRGQAMPDGSYPIANEQDLKNAIQSFGRAKNPAAVKRHIITRARALGLTDLLPEEWKTQKNISNGFTGVFLPE